MTVKCTLRNAQPSSRTYKSSNCSFVNFFQYPFLTFPLGEPQAFFLKKIPRRGGKKQTKTSVNTAEPFALKAVCCSFSFAHAVSLFCRNAVAAPSSPPCSHPCPHSNHFLTSHCVKLPPSPPHTSQHALFAKYIFGLRILPYPDDHFTLVPTAARSNSAEPAARHSTPSLPGVD